MKKKSGTSSNIDVLIDIIIFLLILYSSHSQEPHSFLRVIHRHDLVTHEQLQIVIQVDGLGEDESEL